MNPYANLMNPGQVGQSIQQSFMGGMQLGEKVRGQNALAAYAKNPDDPAAFEGLAQHRPEMAMQVRQQQQQQQQAQAKQRQEVVARAVQMADTPEKWDAMAQQLAQRGIPEAAQYVGKFSPELRSIMMAEAGISSPEDRATSLQKNYEWLQSVNPQAAQQYLKSETEGNPLIASNGDGTFTIIPRGMAQQASPPPPPGFVVDQPQGGPTQPASGNFPSGNPLDPSLAR